MKIIEAMKKIKDLKRKADDLKDKIGTYCADYDINTPTYPDQKAQISEWVQAHGDIIKEIGHLRFGISKTNVMTQVTIELGGKQITKSIAEWIYRRRELAQEDRLCYARLTDRGLQEMGMAQKDNDKVFVKRRLYFDPKERDMKVELYRSEPSIIDGTLEVINAVTDLIY